MKKIVIHLIKAYQKVSFLNSQVFKSLSLTNACCRYSPSCSDYAIEAVTRFGSVKGLYLGLKRIISCHPFSKGGIDPIPSKRLKN